MARGTGDRVLGSVLVTADPVAQRGQSPFLDHADLDVADDSLENQQVQLPPRAFQAARRRARRGARRARSPSGRRPENPHHVWHTWDERARILIPPETVKKSYSTSRLFAAVYPEAVSVAALLASPHWRRLASGTAGERESFYGEISKCIDYPYRSNHDHSDAIAHWADTDASGRCRLRRVRRGSGRSAAFRHGCPPSWLGSVRRILS